jgi:hypothetical protein
MTTRLTYSGAVDADGHILEPPDLWEQYLEPRYRDRALRLRKDADGLEYLEINGAPSRLTRRGAPGMLGGMGKTTEQILPSPERTYLRSAPFGSMNAQERLQLLDQEGLDAAFLYPTIELLWEAECEGRGDLAGLHARLQSRSRGSAPSDTRARGSRRWTRLWRPQLPSWALQSPEAARTESAERQPSNQSYRSTR